MGDDWYFKGERTHFVPLVCTLCSFVVQAFPPLTIYNTLIKLFRYVSN